MAFLESYFYTPLLKSLNPAENKYGEFLNAKDALEEAVRAGTVDYDGRGTFTGNFSAAISKRLRDIGAKFNQVKKAWYIDLSRVPDNIRIAQVHANDAFMRMRKSVLKTLDDSTIDSVFAHHFNTSYVQEKYERAIEWMNDDFEKTVKSVAIPPTLTAAQKKIISNEWTNNLSLYIRGWTKENTAKLRDQVQQMAFVGQRSSSMVKLIQDNYGVAQSKAKFLARQETSLLLSKFRETRYKDVGVEKYVWQTAHDSRVREDHVHLDGKIFRFDSPPCANPSQSGKRMYCNPGEDFNCRCVARPIWE